MLVTLKAMKITSANIDISAAVINNDTSDDNIFVSTIVSSEVREVLTAYDWGEFNVSFRKYLEQNKIDYDYITCENLEQVEELLSD